MSNELGDSIRRVRETRRMTQEELAEAIGVSMRTVGNWERGASVPRNRLGALAEALRVDVAYRLPDGGPFLVLEVKNQGNVQGAGQDPTYVADRRPDDEESGITDDEVLERIDRMAEELRELRQRIVQERGSE